MADESDGILLLNATEIKALLDMDRCIEAVGQAFKLHGEGKALPTGLLHAEALDGDFHIKTGGLDSGRSYFALKANGRYPHNRVNFGLPNVQGVIYLADARTGTPLALMDSTDITRYRTAAATAVATRKLAKSGPAIVTVCGCGNQGRMQLAAIARVRKIDKAYAYARTPERVIAFCEEMTRRLNAPVVPAPTLTQAAQDSNIIVTATPSKQFFLGVSDVKSGTFVAAIGADSAYKQELDPRLMIRNKIVVDIAEQAAHNGELHHAIDLGLCTQADIHAELGQILAGKKPGRTSEEEIILFDSTGTALQDVAVAAQIYEDASLGGRGLRVNLQN